MKLGRLLPAALLLGALAGAEAVLREKLGPPPREAAFPDFDYYYSDINKDFFRPVLNNEFSLAYTTARPRAESQTFLASKPAGTVRVFVVGGSVAVMFADEPAVRIREFFRKSFPGKTIEVISCGMGGYDSYRDSLVLKDVLRHEPDAIVVLSGNNEYFEPETVASPTLYHLTRALRRLWLFRWPQERWLPSRTAARPTRKDRLANFESNLRRMALQAHERNVPLVFCTLPANIRDYPPLSGRPAFGTPGYLDAWAAFDAGDDRAATEKFGRYAAAHPEDPFGHYWLAKSLDRRGLRAAAREQYRLALEYDDPGERCSPARNDIIRRVARDTGMIAADLEKTFDAIAEDGITDGRIFADPMHWRKEYYPLASSVILRAVHDAANAGGTPRSLADGWDWSWYEASKPELLKPAVGPESRAKSGDEEVYRAMTYAVRENDGLSEGALALFADEARQDPARFEFLTGSYDNVRKVFETYVWLRASADDVRERWDEVLIHRGETYRRQRLYARALRDFDAVLARDPGPGRDRALLLRAMTLAKLGRTAEVRESLEKISEAFRRLPEFVYWRARLAPGL